MFIEGNRSNEINNVFCSQVQQTPTHDSVFYTPNPDLSAQINRESVSLSEKLSVPDMTTTVQSTRMVDGLRSRVMREIARNGRKIRAKTTRDSRELRGDVARFTRGRQIPRISRVNGKLLRENMREKMNLNSVFKIDLFFLCQVYNQFSAAIS